MSGPQRLVLLGRCSNGAQRGGGKVAHLVEVGKARALCQATYGRMSAGWTAASGSEKDCQKCLRIQAARSLEGAPF
jgi:hypothetical protein